MIDNSLAGVGINLRLDYIDELLEKKPNLPFVEVIADNWLSFGPHHKKLEKVRELYPISFHCVGMNLCSDDKIDSNYIDSIKNLSERFNPFQISDHLSVQALDGNYFHDLLPHPFSLSIIKSTANKIDEIQNILKRQILVENLSYYHQFEESEMKEYEFINQLAELADCHILFDLNNIWVNEMNYGICSENFLKKINHDRVKEIHIAGAEIIDGIYVDTHGSSVNESVRALLKRAEAVLGDCPIVYERDNNLPTFGEFIKERVQIEEMLYAPA